MGVGVFTLRPWAEPTLLSGEGKQVPDPPGAEEGVEMECPTSWSKERLQTQWE